MDITDLGERQRAHVIHDAVADHVDDAALEDAVGELLIVLVRDGGWQLLPLAKVVGRLGLGTVGLRKNILSSSCMSSSFVNKRERPA